MARKIFILNKDGDVDLIVENVKPEIGPPTSGLVINGAWHWRREGDTHYALRSEYDSNEQAVTVRTIADFRWVGVRPKMRELELSAEDMIPF